MRVGDFNKVKVRRDGEKNDIWIRIFGVRLVYFELKGNWRIFFVLRYGKKGMRIIVDI